jgi:hypothetical protein
MLTSMAVTRPLLVANTSSMSHSMFFLHFRRTFFADWYSRAARHDDAAIEVFVGLRVMSDATALTDLLSRYKVSYGELK